MKLKLDPQRRAEILDKFIRVTYELLEIATEIKSIKMMVKIDSLGETFFNRMSQDKNLSESVDIEAEMDDDSGDESGLCHHNVDTDY
jgi:hypothetical protein